MHSFGPRKGNKRRLKKYLLLVSNTFSSVLEDFNIHVCQESIRTSLVNRKIKVKKTITRQPNLMAYKFTNMRSYKMARKSSAKILIKDQTITLQALIGFSIFFIFEEKKHYAGHVVSSSYFQKFEQGYHATDFHGINLIVQEDDDPYAWYCLTLNIQKLADETAVVKNIQQGNKIQLIKIC